jgi:hypothetical protein
MWWDKWLRVSALALSISKLRIRYPGWKDEALGGNLG